MQKGAVQAGRPVPAHMELSPAAVAPIRGDSAMDMVTRGEQLDLQPDHLRSDPWLHH